MKYLLILLAITIVACSPAPNEYVTTSSAKWKMATIEVHWMRSPAEVDMVCSEMYDIGIGNAYAACARTKPGSNVCEIYAIQPADFDDTKNLTTFGHESWHCFGATHK